MAQELAASALYSIKHVRGVWLRATFPRPTFIADLVKYETSAEEKSSIVVLLKKTAQNNLQLSVTLDTILWELFLYSVWIVPFDRKEHLKMQYCYIQNPSLTIILYLGESNDKVLMSTARLRLLELHQFLLSQHSYKQSPILGD
ncbi:UNVERIFIED_CONTAM: hypothetical protein K2H54_074777 [Gekko kuhli]